jgi:outer membrane protein assembly factor BamB
MQSRGIAGSLVFLPFGGAIRCDRIPTPILADRWLIFIRRGWIVRILLLKTLLGSLVLIGAGLAFAADWAQWRGPNRDGISAETGLLKEWPKDGPRLLWETHDLGSGYSTPAVVGDRLYLISNSGMEDEHVQALAVADGKQIWSTKIGKVGPNQGPQYPGSRSTPTVEGEFLYALGSDGDLVCIETNTGVIRWQKNLRKDFGGQPGMWAYSESPLVDGDTVICTPGGKQATMVALDKKTGQTIWTGAVPTGDKAGYASPIRVEAGGHTQYVTFMEKGVVGVDAKSGKFLWRYDQTGKGPANIPTPVAHDGMVYSASAKTGGGLVRIKAKGEGVEAEQVYYERGLPSNIGGAVLVGPYLYGTGGSDMSAQGLICAEFATGKVKWQDKSLGAAATCYADGCLYLHCENGKVALVEETPEAYRNKGIFTPPGLPKRARGMMEKAWCYPVVANGKLYIRDLDAMWCYDVKGAN